MVGGGGLFTGTLVKNGGGMRERGITVGFCSMFTCRCQPVQRILQNTLAGKDLFPLLRLAFQSWEEQCTFENGQEYSVERLLRRC